VSEEEVQSATITMVFGPLPEQPRTGDDGQAEGPQIELAATEIRLSGRVVLIQ